VTREFARHGGGKYEGAALDDIIFQIDGRELLGIVLVLAFLFVPIGISFMPYRGDPSKPPLFDQLQKRMGLANINSGLLFVAIALWSLIFASLVLGLLGIIWSFIMSPVPQEGQIWNWRFSLAKMAALTATLGAVMALPFTLIRLTFTRTQTETAVEALFNDKINAAVEDLHAQRQVSELMTDGGIQKHETVWRDDVTRRNGSIDRLEGLVQENPVAAPRIARMLSVYVRELSQQYEPAPFPEGSSIQNIKNWASYLQPSRSDMQNAAQVLGRLQNISDSVKLLGVIDLSASNLQAFNLEELRLESTKFDRAHLQKATLRHANLKHASLLGAQMQEAHLEGARLQGAQLVRAKLQGAHLKSAQLQGANLNLAGLQGANLRFAKLQGANLRGAQLQGTDLKWSELQRADLDDAQLQEANLVRASLQGASLGSTNLQGAQLRKAKLQGADLTEAIIDNSTLLTGASFIGAALKGVDFTDSTVKPGQLYNAFGDASTILPSGYGPDHADWPNHWPKEELDWDDFDDEWRAFQRSIGQDPDNPE
jgi:uncharacterized protein YjbI with pentapeptide repeats